MSRIYPNVEGKFISVGSVQVKALLPWTRSSMAGDSVRLLKRYEGLPSLCLANSTQRISIQKYWETPRSKERGKGGRRRKILRGLSE